MNDPVLSVQDVAERLGRCTVTIRRMIKRGELRGVKRGGRLYVRESAVEEFLGDPVPA